MNDWLNFFADSIAAIHDPLSVILGASGCREKWLHGELFRAGRQYDLRVDEYNLGNSNKADLSCALRPAMIAEIKIVGADYLSKMQAAIESDVQRMREVGNPDVERYMILIVPRSDAKTPLGAYLESCSFSSTCVEREFPGFRLRIWRL